LGPLVKKVKEFQIELIIDTLCANMLSEKEQLKDISSIGLKTVINHLSTASTQMNSNIVKKIAGRLLSTMQKVSNLSESRVLFNKN
jgi:cullin-associated NEDD8-dissociated protein 1